MDGILENFNDKSVESTFTSSDVESNKIIVAVCCIVSILFFLPLLMDKNSAYCKFYAFVVEVFENTVHGFYLFLYNFFVFRTFPLYA